MKSLIETLMEMDDLTREEAQAYVDDMNERMHDGEDPEELLYEIGLEPDYLFDLLY